MIRSRPKPKVQRSPAPLSDDRFNKLEFVRAPHYYAAVAEWYDRLSLDQQELVHIVVHIYTTPSYGGEAVATTYAAGLPSVPTPPDVVRKAWGHD